MVLIHIKRTETDQFLYETSTKASVDEVIRDLVRVNNKRILIQQLALACERLAEHGPMKKPDQQGIDEVLEKAGESIDKGPHYKADPLGQRTGNACAPELAEVIRKTCREAEAAASKDQMARKVPLSPQALQEKVDNVHGAVKIAYPMGLPEWDVVRHMVEGRADFAGSQAGSDMLDEDSATLWWAGKEFFRDQTVGDRVGRNEKTKIVGKLQAKGSGAPVREPAVTEDERKAMMAHYFKKQEEAKALAEEDDDDYLHRPWADSRQLKKSLHGAGSGVAFRPGGGAL